jgi:hypothetical protein
MYWRYKLWLRTLSLLTCSLVALLGDSTNKRAALLTFSVVSLNYLLFRYNICYLCGEIR